MRPTPRTSALTRQGSAAMRPTDLSPAHDSPAALAAATRVRAPADSAHAAVAPRLRRIRCATSVAAATCAAQHRARECHTRQTDRDAHRGRRRAERQWHRARAGGCADVTGHEDACVTRGSGHAIRTTRHGHDHASHARQRCSACARSHDAPTLCERRDPRAAGRRRRARGTACGARREYARTSTRLHTGALTKQVLLRGDRT